MIGQVEKWTMKHSPALFVRQLGKANWEWLKEWRIDI
jgi:hypothetical protein